MTDEFVIPEDLRKLYESCWLGKGYPGQHTEHIIPLIKRIAKLEAERDELRKAIQRLTARVSDEEWKTAATYYTIGDFMERDSIDAMIAARLEGESTK